MLGRTKPFCLHLEGVASQVEIHPYVVRDLAHPVNLGQGFLRRNNVELSFKPDCVTLKISGHVTRLGTNSESLAARTVDKFIQGTLTKWESGGRNPSAHGAVLNVRNRTKVRKVRSLDGYQGLPGLLHEDYKRSVQI